MSLPSEITAVLSVFQSVFTAPAIQSITLICSQSEPEIIPGRTFPGLLPGNRPQGDGLLLKKGALFRLYVLGVVSSPEG